MERNIDLEKAAREECNRYYREWRKANKDKVKEHNKRYWERRAEKALAAMQNDDGSNKNDAR